jgi:hypothetical protein
MGVIDYLDIPDDRDYSKRVEVYFNQPSVASANEISYIKPGYTDTVYRYDGKKCSPYLYIDLGSNKLPANMFYDRMKFYRESSRYSYTGSMSTFSDKFLIIQIFHKGEWHLGIHDIAKQQNLGIVKQTKLNSYSYYNDIDGGPNLGMYKKMYGDAYYDCNSASSLISNRDKGLYNVKQVKSSDTRERFLQMLNNVSEEDNPVIQIFYLK